MELNALLSFGGVMKSLVGVLLAIVILLSMVTIHEFGHYVAGKLLGFKINEFAVGFGPAILKKRSKKTGELFALRVIPLGGYCAFDGEDEFEDEGENKGKDGEENLSQQPEEEPFNELSKKEEISQNDGGMSALNDKSEEFPEPKGARFNDQAPWKRIIVLLAGATMNYLLALVLIITMFAFVGRPLYTVMENPEQPSLETIVDEEGLMAGDVIMKLDGQHVYMITDYLDVLEGKKAGDRVPVTVLRDGKRMQVTITLALNADFVNMSDTMTLLQSMGIYGLYTTTEKQGFFPTLGHSMAYSVKVGGTVLRSLGELLTGKIGLESMGGPITTIQITSEAASTSLLSFLSIAAFIGANLAVFNLLPIPALDGCKVIFCILEWIRKKPINRKVETMIHFVGILFLFGFAILVDLLNLF